MNSSVTVNQPEKKSSVSRLLRTATLGEAGLASRKEISGKMRPLSAIFLPKKHSSTTTSYTLENNRTPPPESVAKIVDIDDNDDDDKNNRGEETAEIDKSQVDGVSWLKKVRPLCCI